MAKSLIVGNWKMHHNTHQASLLLHSLSGAIKPHRDVEVVLCPNFLVLQSLSLQLNHRQFKLGAQNCNWHDDGAYTGEVSATMLRGLVDYVIVGHSERRHIFGERGVDIRKKVQAAIRNDIHPILCIGETATEKADGETKHVLHDQLVSGLANVTSDEIGRMVIAYEPVWALSNGKNFAHHATPKPDDVKAVVTVIRHQIGALYGRVAAEEVRILYGGSASAENAGSYLSVEGIDGLLVGGASLVAHEFTNIIEIAHSRERKE